MMRKRSLGLFAMLVLASACASIKQPASNVPARVAIEQLLTTDQSAGATPTEGLSGLTNLFDDEVVLFAVPVPGFAEGRGQARATLVQAVDGESGITSWAPIRAGVSGDGLHGFTFGYTMTERPGEPRRLGKYVAYWARRAQGWRILLYKRIPRGEGAVATELMPPAMPGSGRRATDPALLESYRLSLRQREQAFSDSAQSIGLGPAFARFGSPDAVNVGGEPGFLVGVDAIAASFPEGASPLAWAADKGVVVAASGDLGVTWGFLRRNGPTPPGRLSEIPFFTIWRRSSPSDPWLYIAE